MHPGSVLIVSPSRSFRAQVPTARPVVLGRGKDAELDVQDASLPPRAVSLVARDEAVLVEPLKPWSGARLNDVQLSGPATLRPGDELQLGQTRVVVLPAPAHPPQLRPRLAGHDELLARLEDEVQRARPARRPVGFALVLMPPLNTPARQAFLRRLWDDARATGAAATLGEVTSDVLGVVLPELGEAPLKAYLGHLGAVAGPRARVAAAVLPRHGVSAEALLAHCLAGLWTAPDVEEPVVVEPVMVRLFDVAAQLAEQDAPVRIEGPDGAGRETLARALAPGQEARAAQGDDPEGVDRALAEPAALVVVRDAGRVDPAQLVAWARTARNRGRRLAVTCGPGELEGLFEHALPVPALAERPLEIPALADAFLSRARGLLGRPRLTLAPEARTLLLRHPWPGNVRELRNVVTRAARAAVRDELGPDALSSRLTQGASAEDLRGALKDAERALLLEALARTRWNVSAAAARLGMPRRTVVYRMGKLGLRRPAR